MRAATVDGLDHGTIAVKFQIKRALVHRILKVAKETGDLCESLLGKRARRVAKIRGVIESVAAMRRRRLQIWRAAQVAELVQREHQLKVSGPFVSQVLRKHLGMRYKLVQRTPFAGNSDRSLALRFSCAKVILGLL